MDSTNSTNTSNTEEQVSDDFKIIKEELLFTIETPGIQGKTMEERRHWLKENQPMAYAALRMLGIG